MNRDSENTIMLLVGVATLMITISGAFTRYVKPSLMPWLYVTAAVLIVMALVAMIGDSRGSAGPNDHGDHSHASHATWLLMVPILVLIFVAPPALRPRPACRASARCRQKHYVGRFRRCRPAGHQRFR